MQHFFILKKFNINKNTNNTRRNIMSKTKTQEEFIKEIKEIFPELDFSRSIYKGCREKIEVGCKHGYWLGTPRDLYHGHRHLWRYGSSCLRNLTGCKQLLNHHHR